MTDPAERLRLFGQADHVRIYGEDYADRLATAGFHVLVDRFVERLSPERRRYLGLDDREAVYFCRKGPPAVVRG